ARFGGGGDRVRDPLSRGTRASRAGPSDPFARARSKPANRGNCLPRAVGRPAQVISSASGLTSRLPVFQILLDALRLGRMGVAVRRRSPREPKPFGPDFRRHTNEKLARRLFRARLSFLAIRGT